MSKFVRIHELMNTCVILSAQAGNTVRGIVNSGALNVVHKAAEFKDVTTDADLIIQRTVHYNLSQLYPKAKFVCEEEDSMIPERIKPSITPDRVL